MSINFLSSLCHPSTSALIEETLNSLIYSSLPHSLSTHIDHSVVPFISLRNLNNLSIKQFLIVDEKHIGITIQHLDGEIEQQYQNENQHGGHNENTHNHHHHHHYALYEGNPKNPNPNGEKHSDSINVTMMSHVMKVIEFFKGKSNNTTTIPLTQSPYISRSPSPPPFSLSFSLSFRVTNESLRVTVFCTPDGNPISPKNVIDLISCHSFHPFLDAHVESLIPLEVTVSIMDFSAHLNGEMLTDSTAENILLQFSLSEFPLKSLRVTTNFDECGAAESIRSEVKKRILEAKEMFEGGKEKEKEKDKKGKGKSNMRFTMKVKTDDLYSMINKNI